MALESKKVIEQAEETNALLAAMVESSEDAIVGEALNGKITYWNGAAERLFGFTSDEAVGRPSHFFAPRESIRADAELRFRVIQGQEVGPFDEVRVDKNGSTLEVSDTISPIKDATGRVIGTSRTMRDISARKMAERELREAKLFAGQILERVTDGFLAVDTNWRLSYINRYAAEVLGRLRPAHELLGQDFWESFPGLVGTVAEREYRRAMAEQRATRFEIHYPPLRGWFEISAYPSPEGLSIYFTEITRRKTLEQSLHESQELLRGIIDNTGVVIYAKDLEGRYLLINRRYSELFHVTAEAIAGKTDYDIFPKEAADRIRDFDRRVQRADTPLAEEERMPQRDGAHTFLSIKCPLHDQSGRSYAIIGISTDITERKRMEETLRESEERFRTLADNIAQFAWMADAKGSIFWYNKRWFEYTGATLEEMHGWGWRKAHHPDHVGRVVEKIRHAFETGEYWEDTFPLRAKDGSYRWFLSRAIPIRNAQGEVVRWLGTNTDITDRKQAEETLRESEERFRTLADNIAQIAWMADQAGSVFWVNKRWSEITGTTLEDVRGWGWQRLHHPDHVDRVVAKIRKVVDTGQSWEETFLLRCKDGAYRWFLSRGVPIRNEQQQVVRWLGTSTDITDHLESEKALAAARDRAEESERLFRAFVTASSDVVYRMNADWTVMRRLEGKDFIADTHDASRSWLKNYIFPDDQPRVLAAVDEAIRQKKIFELEHRVIRVDGTLGWTFSRAIPLLDEHGAITEWFGAALDVTERKRAEEALQRLTEKSEHQRRLYDTLLASTPDQICVFGLDRRFIYVNPALLGTLGREREQVIGRSCAEAGFESQQGVCHDQEIADVIATKHPIRGEAVYVGADGRRIYDYLLVPVLGTAGDVEAVGGSMRDITDQKRIAENLERMVGERTAKLRETIGELEAFSYSIAHDLRAPLRSLQGYAEVLLAEHSDRLAPDGKEYLERIGTAANRMDRLILDVLNYSRIVRSDLRLERVPLGSLIDDIIETYPMFAPEKADIEVARPLPTVLGNDAMLTQVFSNLLGNAVKFTAAGLRPKIKVWSEFRGPYARVLVRDNGIGIAEDQHQKIFEVFQQADTRHGGTGIGLAIVKKAIERI